MRLREYSEKIPKPMVPIGYRPVLWHVMKYYAHFGHTDFILCLGHQADVIKDYFVNYNEYVSNDFVLNKGSNVKLMNTDIDDWNITFADTGVNSNIGQRLLAARKYVTGEKMFLANYSDGLTDLPLDDMVAKFQATDKIASFMAARPTRSFHMATIGADNVVTDMSALSERENAWINGGYFVFRSEIFNHISPGEELVEEPFRRLIADRKLLAYPHEGVFLTMDTFKEKQTLDEMYAKGLTPWQVWKKDNPGNYTSEAC
jgi:glucose-1-phosphate cytidylyltransferase